MRGLTRSNRAPISFPGGKKFAFAIFDDTDNGTLHNLTPVYDLLSRLGIRSTKSIWVYSSRGSFRGDTLESDEYRRFILELKRRGFEIALHNVGDGAFTRPEILSGLDRYREALGEYPSLHTNHSWNPDNLYWGADRFVWPMDAIYRLIGAFRPGWNAASQGSVPGSPFFWGDVAKRHIKFIRNLTFNGINLRNYDPLIPYRERRKLEHSNYWFSSSDGHTVDEMNNLLSHANVEKLERENGICIVYTHFASRFVDETGKVHPDFVNRLTALSRRQGWFVPVGELLDFLISRRRAECDATYSYLLRLNILWLLGRIVKRLRFGR